jgi:hypothetical protein
VRKENQSSLGLLNEGRQPYTGTGTSRLPIRTIAVFETPTERLLIGGTGAGHIRIEHECTVSSFGRDEPTPDDCNDATVADVAGPHVAMDLGVAFVMALAAYRELAPKGQDADQAHEFATCLASLGATVTSAPAQQDDPIDRLVRAYAWVADTGGDLQRFYEAVLTALEFSQAHVKEVPMACC